MAHTGGRCQPDFREKCASLLVYYERWRTCADINLAEGVGFETGVRAVLMRKLPRYVPVLPKCLTQADQARRGSPRHNHVDRKTHQLGREGRKSFSVPLRKPIDEEMSLSFDIAEVAQPVPQSLQRWPELVRKNTDFQRRPGVCARAAPGPATTAPPSSVI